MDNLRKRDRVKLLVMFKRLRDAQRKIVGEEAFEDLKKFLSERNRAPGLALRRIMR